MNFFFILQYIIDIYVFLNFILNYPVKIIIILRLRSCAWGQHRANDDEEEKHDEEKAEDETVVKEPEPVKEKGEDFDFIVSGAIGHGSESPEVKVWRVNNDKIKLIHSLIGHSLGIVSVDVSPNGKCKIFLFMIH